MNHNQDECLLLLAHNELGKFQALLLKLHIIICPSCRTKYQHFQQLSLLIASEIRSESGTPWNFRTGSGGRLRMLTLTLLALIAILLWSRQSPPLLHVATVAVGQQNSHHCK